MWPICSRVFFSSLAIAVCPCVAICAEFETPSCSALVTLSSRWETLWPIVAICPVLCAWAVPIVCKSRRSSSSWPSSSALFFCSCEVCSTSQSTSPATTITTPMSTPVITFSSPSSGNGPLTLPGVVYGGKLPPKQKGLAFAKPLCHSVPRQFYDATRPVILLPAHLHRKLQLPRRVRRRRLPRAASRTCRRIAKLVHRRNIGAVEKVEGLGDQVELNSLAHRYELGHAHIPREEARHVERIPTQAAYAPRPRSRKPRHRELLGAVCQTNIGKRKSDPGNVRRRCTARRRASPRGTRLRSSQVQPRVLSRNDVERPARRNFNDRRNGDVPVKLLKKVLALCACGCLKHSAGHPTVRLVVYGIGALELRKTAVLRLQRGLQVRTIVDRMRPRIAG